DSRASAELLDRRGGGLVEAVRPVRVPPDGREHLLVRLSRSDRAGVRVLAEPDREDPPDARLTRRVHELSLVRLAETQVRVGIGRGSESRYETTEITEPTSDRGHERPPPISRFGLRPPLPK